MEYNHVYHADSDVMLGEMLAQGVKFDLILTDPPYNLNKDFGNDSDKLPLPSFLDVTQKRLETCRDLLTPTGSIVWFGIHNYIGFIQVIMYNIGLHYPLYSRASCIGSFRITRKDGMLPRGRRGLKVRVLSRSRQASHARSACGSGILKAASAGSGYLPPAARAHALPWGRVWVWRKEAPAYTGA